MGRHTRIIPLSAVRFVLQKHRVGLRLSADACASLATLAESYGEQLAVSAKDIAQHKGKRTIEAEDITMAIALRRQS